MAVSASGVMIPPLFIFKGKRVPSNLLHGSPPASKVKVSDNAFVDTDIFDQWIDHFIESIPAARPVLLTLDNHSAHIALHVRRKCILKKKVQSQMSVSHTLLFTKLFTTLFTHFLQTFGLTA